MSQDFFHQLLEFVVRHWMMVGAFVLVLAWIVVEEVRSKALGANQITSQQLTYAMNRDQCVLVDVRDAQAFREGHIINAVNITAGEIERDNAVLNKFKDKEIVFVDANGMKSTSLATQLRNKEFKVSVLRGGLSTWKQDNMPLVKGK